MNDSDVRAIIRKRLLCCIPEPVKIKLFVSIEDLERTQWCPEFFEFMKRRMIMGAFRYGKLITQQYSSVKYNNIKSIRNRLNLYEETGNTEHLIDCANLLMIEYMIGEHPTKHFKAVDDGQHSELKK